MSQDLDFRVDKSKPSENDYAVEAWAWKKLPVNSNDKTGLAKKLTDNHTGTTKYYVKCASFGSDRGILYNPAGMHSLPLNTVGLDGKLKYDYQKVSKNCFDLYCNFLENNNQVALTQAQQVYNGETH